MRLRVLCFYQMLCSINSIIVHLFCLSADCFLPVLANKRRPYLFKITVRVSTRADWNFKHVAANLAIYKLNAVMCMFVDMNRIYLAEFSSSNSGIRFPEG